MEIIKYFKIVKYHIFFKENTKIVILLVLEARGPRETIQRVEKTLSTINIGSVRQL